MVVETVLAFYAARAREEGGLGAKSGAVTAVQRTSSDLRLNPHLHLIALDGVATVGEATEVPQRSPGRGPPNWKSRVLRLKALGDEDEGAGLGHGADEEVA